MAQAHALGISDPVVLRAPRPEFVLRAVRGVLVLFLMVGCCSVAFAIASPIRSGSGDRSDTNSFGSSSPSAVFSPRVKPVERVPNAPTNFRLRSVPCAPEHSAAGTTCFIPD